MSQTKLHDLLLEGKPEGAHHNQDKCPICSGREASQEENVADNNANLTQEQHEALVLAAVEKAIDEGKTESDAEILRLNEQLAQANEETESKDATITELNTQIEKRDETERLDELADERAELVRAAKINFSDEQIESRKESWAKKDQDEFEALVEDYKAVATAKKVVNKTEKPLGNDLDVTRVTAGNDTGPNALRAFFGKETADDAQGGE